MEKSVDAIWRLENEQHSQRKMLLPTTICSARMTMRLMPTAPARLSLRRRANQATVILPQTAAPTAQQKQAFLRLRHSRRSQDRSLLELEAASILLISSRCAAPTRGCSTTHTESEGSVRRELLVGHPCLTPTLCPEPSERNPMESRLPHRRAQLQRLLREERQHEIASSGARGKEESGAWQCRWTKLSLGGRVRQRSRR